MSRAVIRAATSTVQPAAPGACSVWPVATCSAAPRTDSLEKKPLKGGIAASASRATVIVQ
ncbi:hypothetical protein SVIOM342S_02863 [Streptomyces violaceorubidus]